MRRTLVVLGLAVTLSLSGAIGLVRGGSDPAPPAVDIAGATGLSARTVGDLDDTIEWLQTRLRSLPSDQRSWAVLALAYVEKSRVTGNPDFLARAARSIERAKSEADGAGSEVDPLTHASAAALAAARHDFAASLRSADRALDANPYDATALAVRVDALTELGRYDEQLRAVDDADRRQPGVPVAARYSYALELRGRLAPATAVLRRSVPAATHADRAYLLTLAADLERRRGRLGVAARDLRSALRENPDHVPALVSRARLDVARGDLRAASGTWEQVVRRLPLAEYLTELGELYLALGDTEAARRQFDVVTATNRLTAEQGVNVDLESALHEADHGSPEAALTAARAEWRRRQSIHVADALAWALHVNGRHRAALARARDATSLGTQEARLWQHRGLVEAALGMDGAARRHLRRGLAADPGSSPWQRARARAALTDLGGRS